MRRAERLARGVSVAVAALLLLVPVAFVAWVAADGGGVRFAWLSPESGASCADRVTGTAGGLPRFAFCFSWKLFFDLVSIAIGGAVALAGNMRRSARLLLVGVGIVALAWVVGSAEWLLAPSGTVLRAELGRDVVRFALVCVAAAAVLALPVLRPGRRVSPSP